MISILLKHKDPRSILNWLAKSFGGELLAATLQNPAAITHEQLDAFPRPKAAEFLRSLLIAAGILTNRPRWRSVEIWLATAVSGLSPSDATSVKRFALWSVARRLRLREEVGKITTNSVRFAKARTRAAVTFITWLNGFSVALADADQTVVDKWYARRTSTKYVASEFIRWASKNNCIDRLVRVPNRPHAEIGSYFESEQVDVLAIAATLPLVPRAAILLNYYYGQQLSRIVAISSNNLVSSGDSLYLLRRRERKLKLLREIAALLEELLEHSRANPKARRGDGHFWLFPGNRHGEHLSARQMEKQFAKAGICARQTRNAALAHFASTTPAPIISALLGLHPNTAAEWSRTFGSDYGNLIRIRKADFYARTDP